MRRVLFFVYQWIIFVPVLVLSTLITAIIVMIGCSLGGKKFWGYYPPKYWSKIVCRAALCRINVQKNKLIDKNKSYVFVANHQGAFDVFLTYGYLDQNIKWVQKQELRKLPFVGKASEIAGHVFVDSSSIKSLHHTIDKAEKELEDGTSMVIFPEGARTRSGKMKSFKKGAFVIATQMQLPIVPITINGPFNVLKRGEAKMNFLQKMELIIHDPISTIGKTEEDIPELIEQSYKAVQVGLWAKYKKS